MNGIGREAWTPVSQLFDRLSYLPILVICLTVHELGHGLAAYAMGDETARRSGRLSLNPLAHLDPTGLLMMLLFGFGWARPVPVDPSRFRRPRIGMAVTAAAGPLMNVATAAIALPLAMRMRGGFADALAILAVYSVNLAAFNLIPLPPLDGSRIILPLMPPRLADRWARLDGIGWIVLLALSYAGLLQIPIGIMREAVLALLSPLI